MCKSYFISFSKTSSTYMYIYVYIYIYIYIPLYLAHGNFFFFFLFFWPKSMVEKGGGWFLFYLLSCLDLLQFSMYNKCTSCLYYYSCTSCWPLSQKLLAKRKYFSSFFFLFWPAKRVHVGPTYLHFNGLVKL